MKIGRALPEPCTECAMSCTEYVFHSEQPIAPWYSPGTRPYPKARGARTLQQCKAMEMLHWHFKYGYITVHVRYDLHSTQMTLHVLHNLLLQPQRVASLRPVT